MTVPDGFLDGLAPGFGRPHVVRVQHQALLLARHLHTENVFLYLLKAYSPVNRTGSPQGFTWKMGFFIY